MSFLNEKLVTRPYSIRDAIQKIGEWREKEKKKVVHSIALQSSGIKYALKQIGKLLSSNSESWIIPMTDELTPPMQDEKLLDYAQLAHENFSKRWRFLLTNASDRNVIHSNEIKEFIKEIEETLESIRRTTVQNLSKHPSNKPLELLNELDKLYELRYHSKSELRSVQKKINDVRNQIGLLQEKIESLRNSPSYETVSRLASSRDLLLHQKQEIEKKWDDSWKKISPVFYRLHEKTNRFKKMENSQLRWLQLYLANPSKARVRDPSGQGLFMLLNLSADALGEKNSKLTKTEIEHSRKMLMGALEGNNLEDFFWKSNKLEAALNANSKEYWAHPLYSQEVEWRRVQSGLAGEYELLSSQKKDLEKKGNELNQSVSVLEKEAGLSCQSLLGIKLVFDE